MLPSHLQYTFPFHSFFCSIVGLTITISFSNRPWAIRCSRPTNQSSQDWCQLCQKWFGFLKNRETWQHVMQISCNRSGCHAETAPVFSKQRTGPSQTLQRNVGKPHSLGRTGGDIAQSCRKLLKMNSISNSPCQCDRIPRPHLPSLN